MALSSHQPTPRTLSAAGAVAAAGHACPINAAAPRGPVLIASWIFQIASAAIMGQTLFFKFAAAEEPVLIFTRLHAEPWGRLGTGAFELVAAVLLLWPRLAVFGAALGVGLMLGAIGSHLGPLGIVIKNDAGKVIDSGELFASAVATLLMCVGVLLIRRKQVFAYLAKLRPGAKSAH